MEEIWLFKNKINWADQKSMRNLSSASYCKRKHLTQKKQKNKTKKLIYPKKRKTFERANFHSCLYQIAPFNIAACCPQLCQIISF